MISRLYHGACIHGIHSNCVAPILHAVQPILSSAHVIQERNQPPSPAHQPARLTASTVFRQFSRQPTFQPPGSPLSAGGPDSEFARSGSAVRNRDLGDVADELSEWSHGRSSKEAGAFGSVQNMRGSAGVDEQAGKGAALAVELQQRAGEDDDTMMHDERRVL